MCSAFFKRLCCLQACCIKDHEAPKPATNTTTATCYVNHACATDETPDGDVCDLPKTLEGSICVEAPSDVISDEAAQATTAQSTTVTSSCPDVGISDDVTSNAALGISRAKAAFRNTSVLRNADLSREILNPATAAENTNPGEEHHFDFDANEVNVVEDKETLRLSQSLPVFIEPTRDRPGRSKSDSSRKTQSCPVDIYKVDKNMGCSSDVTEALRRIASLKRANGDRRLVKTVSSEYNQHERDSGTGSDAVVVNKTPCQDPAENSPETKTQDECSRTGCDAEKDPHDASFDLVMLPDDLCGADKPVFFLVAPDDVIIDIDDELIKETTEVESFFDNAAFNLDESDEEDASAILLSEINSLIAKYTVNNDDSIIDDLCRILENKDGRGGLPPDGVSSITPDICQALVRCGSVEVIQNLFHLMVPFNEPATDGQCPLHTAVQFERGDIVRLLVSKGLGDSVDQHGYTALHTAIRYGLKDMVTLLLPHINNINRHCAAIGWTGLHYSVIRGDVFITEMLLKRGSCVNVLTKQGESCIWLAAQGGHDLLLKILVEAGADVNIQCEHGNTILHVYTERRNSTLVEYLLSHDAKLDVANSDGHSVMHIAAAQGDEHCITQLAKQGTLFDLDDADGNTPTCLAVANGHLSCVEKMLLFGANIHIANKNGDTALHIAIANGYRAIVDFLLRDGGVDVNVLNVNEEAPLHLAVQAGKADLVALLFTRNDVVVDECGASGRTALHEACHYDNSTIVAQLLHKGADITRRDADNLSAIYIAALNRLTDILQFLIIKSSDSSHLFELCQTLPLYDIKYYSHHGIDFDKQDSNGRVPLHHAVSMGDLETTRKLLTVRVRVNVPDNEGNTPLHLVALGGHDTIAEKLLLQDIFITVPNSQNCTPLVIASEKGHTKIVRLLLEKGAPVDTKLPDGRTLLMKATDSQDVSLVELLLSHGANANFMLSESQTRPLHRAALLGNAKIVSMLIERGAKTHLGETSTGMTPLHLAASHGHDQCVVELLAGGADAHMLTARGETAIALAAQRGHVGVVRLLLETGSLPHLVDDAGGVIYELAKHAPVWDLLKSWAATHPHMSQPPQRPLSASLQILCNRVQHLMRTMPRLAIESNNSHC